MERLQKILSGAGVCSRRTAEDYLSAGRITVNGQVAALGDRADPAVDEICLDGQSIGPPAKPVYLMLNKPKGYVTTLQDEKDRPTVAQLVADCGVRVYPVGRLDFDSEGLLLMTNDGAFAQRAMHPKYELTKTYQVEVYGRLEGAVTRLRALRELEGEPIRPARVQQLSQRGGRSVLLVTIHEGKNRQVRRMCKAAELQVARLTRVQEHTLTLGDLPSGRWRWLTAEEITFFEKETAGLPAKE